MQHAAPLARGGRAPGNPIVSFSASPVGFARDTKTAPRCGRLKRSSEHSPRGYGAEGTVPAASVAVPAQAGTENRGDIPAARAPQRSARHCRRRGLTDRCRLLVSHVPEVPRCSPSFLEPLAWSPNIRTFRGSSACRLTAACVQVAQELPPLQATVGEHGAGSSSQALAGTLPDGPRESVPGLSFESPVPSYGEPSVDARASKPVLSWR